MVALPARAAEDAEMAAIRAAHQRHQAKVWPRRLVLRVRGEACDELALQVSQQLMTRVRAERGAGERRLSAFAPECSLAELRDGLVSQFGFILEPYGSAESLHFRIYPRSASKGPRRAAPAVKPVAAPARTPHSPSLADPILARKLDLSAVEIDDEKGGLPVILEAISDAAGVLILADHASPGSTTAGMDAAPFLARLNGLSLKEVLDETAKAFGYRWDRSGRWFLFRPVK
jgi:hypothetical protein